MGFGTLNKEKACVGVCVGRDTIGVAIIVSRYEELELVQAGVRWRVGLYTHIHVYSSVERGKER